MRDTITIAQSTFYRIARMGALYFILAICILDISAMARYKELSLGMEQELVVDSAQAILLIIALLTAMIAAFEIPRELRDKSATYILSKPGGRSSYVWGKFLGIAALVVFNVAIVTAGALVVHHVCFQKPLWSVLPSAGLIAGEGVMLAGVALLFSTFASDTAAAIGVFIVFAAGHAVYMVPRLAPDNAVLDALYLLLPNLYNLDVKTAVSHGTEIPHAFLGMGLLYALGYGVAMAALANIVFCRKDLQ